VEVGAGGPIEVRPLDVVVIPADETQRITNTGPADLLLLCVCTPRFRPACYHAAE
jgi:mannose-6-phosphate isomerase-like protein (cupin superfamily)